MCISRFRGIWKSGYKKIDLIIITLPEGNTKHTNKDRRCLRITLCAHSLPDHGQHHAYNCTWNIFASLQREPNFTLAVGEISQLWLSQFHTSSISHCAGTRSSQMHGAQRTVETRLLMSDCALLKVLPGLGPSRVFLSLLSPNRMQTCRMKMLCCGQQCQKDTLREFTLHFVQTNVFITAEKRGCWIEHPLVWEKEMLAKVKGFGYFKAS